MNAKRAFGISSLTVLLVLLGATAALAMEWGRSLPDWPGRDR